jgi:cell division septal protein FtsQ
MLFRRKPKNRRLGREHVLDVKLRSSQVRKARGRLLAASVGSVFLLVFGLYVLWRGSNWALTELVYENSAFEIQQLDVQTDGVISVNQICRWAGLKPHQNLLALDVSRLKRNLEMVPLVQSVSVERIPPRTLRIHVVEREPVAQVNVPRARPGGGIETSVFQVDSDGYVMIPLDANQRNNSLPSADALPVISGLDPRELQPGHRLGGQSIQAALQVIIAFQQSPMAGLADLKWIDISTPQVLIIKTGQTSEITLGLFDLEQQLRRWRAVYDLGQRLGKQIATLDLAITNSVPLRWHDPDSLPPSLPLPAKPLRLKKSHV